jgi:LPXTG-motif cell wall-anchored protein
MPKFPQRFLVVLLLLPLVALLVGMPGAAPAAGATTTIDRVAAPGQLAVIGIPEPKPSPDPNHSDGLGGKGTVGSQASSGSTDGTTMLLVIVAFVALGGLYFWRSKRDARW